MDNKVAWILLLMIGMPALLFFIPIIVLAVFITAFYMIFAGWHNSHVHDRTKSVA